MTNENMIKQLKRLIPSLKYADDVNAVKGAIKALSQGPRFWIDKDGIVHKLVTMELVPDAVSREAVIEIVNDIRDCISVDGYWAILERLKKLQKNRKYGLLQEMCANRSDSAIRDRLYLLM